MKHNIDDYKRSISIASKLKMREDLNIVTLMKSIQKMKATLIAIV